MYIYTYIIRYRVKRLLVVKKPNLQKKIYLNTLKKYIAMVEGKEQELKQKPHVIFARWEQVRKLIRFGEI